MDYKTWYEKVSGPFRSPVATQVLDVLDRGLVIVIACAYAIMLAWLAISWDGRFWKALVVPALTFALVSVIRSALDAPRPYAVYDIHPLLVKERRGKSFPSRHVSSAMIIACAIAWVSWSWGVPAFIACAVVAATRIIGGVHFPRDVIAAIAISVACGVIGFWLVP